MAAWHQGDGVNNGASGIPGNLPVQSALPRYCGALSWRTYFPLLLGGLNLDLQAGEPMDVGVEPTPIKEITPDLERELLKSPIPETVDPGTSDKEVAKRKRLTGAAKRHLNRLMKSGTPYETALNKVLELKAARQQQQRTEGGQSSTEQTAADKRPRSDGSTPEQRAKRPREGTSKKHSRKPRKWSKWVSYPSAIMQAVENSPDDGPFIRFQGCTQRPGWLLITCVDKVSSEWLEGTIMNLHPWDGAHLKTVQGKDIPRPHVCTEKDEPWPMHPRVDCSTQGAIGPGSDMDVRRRRYVHDNVEGINFRPYFGFGQIQFRPKAGDKRETPKVNPKKPVLEEGKRIPPKEPERHVGKGKNIPNRQTLRKSGTRPPPKGHMTDKPASSSSSSRKSGTSPPPSPGGSSARGVTDLPSSSRIHRILSREPRVPFGSIKKPDGTYTTSGRETLELLIHNHFPGSLILGNQPLEPPKGVTLDKTMTWNPHLDKVIHKAKMSFWTCRRICGKSWGIGPQQMYWIYTTIIRPMIAYGSIVWWSKGRQRTARTKLSGLQRMASLAITGALRTTPSAAMEILLDLPPLHIFMEREARWATYRLHRASSSMLQATTMEQNRLIDDIKSHSILSMPSDVMPSRTSSNLYYKVLFPKRDEWERNKDALQKADSCWFTDGSKTPEGTGAGVHSCNPRTRISVSLGTNATVFQAEVYAIELCVGRLEQMNPIRRTIKIFSDSQAALKALFSYR
ncbi:hypothetical protein NQ317_011243 [Molorchus minor]|uniref:RNase H type-1 domain-containing protein n=1 Tax=Molorchus minor TaxID=1323400 RepID=A0ABQ9J921_9CUCU|nr:hypothetical protein NQ317_011243 [Molorchus minor]